MSANPPFRWEFASRPTEKASGGFSRIRRPLLLNLVNGSTRQLCASESSQDFANSPRIDLLAVQRQQLLPPSARAKAIVESYHPRYLRLWSPLAELGRWTKPLLLSPHKLILSVAKTLPQAVNNYGTFISFHLDKSSNASRHYLKLFMGGWGMCRWPL